MRDNFVKFVDLHGKPAFLNSANCLIHSVETLGDNNSVILWSSKGENTRLYQQTVSMPIEKCLDYIRNNWDLGQQDVGGTQRKIA